MSEGFDEGRRNFMKGSFGVLTAAVGIAAAPGVAIAAVSSIPKADNMGFGVECKDSCGIFQHLKYWLKDLKWKMIDSDCVAGPPMTGFTSDAIMEAGKVALDNHFVEFDRLASMKCQFPWQTAYDAVGLAARFPESLDFDEGYDGFDELDELDEEVGL